MIHDFGVREADDCPAHAFQFDLTEMVPEDDLVEPMDPAIDLHDEPQANTGEISEMAAHRVLSAKPVAVDLSAS